MFREIPINCSFLVILNLCMAPELTMFFDTENCRNIDANEYKRIFENMINIPIVCYVKYLAKQELTRVYPNIYKLGQVNVF